MRFCLQLVARYCSILALTVSTILLAPVSDAHAAQGNFGYGTSQYGAYGSPTATAAPQSFSTSRPFQANAPVSNDQSMSPDSWGNSSRDNSADPFLAGQNYSRPSRRNPSSFANGQPPVQNPAVRNSMPSYANGPATAYPPAFAPNTSSAYQYESTGAPSVKDLVGGQVPPPPTRSVRSASPFRPAEFDAQDPREIPHLPFLRAF
jgi:hypothetical protein